jgi:hypothetical protein
MNKNNTSRERRSSGSIKDPEEVLYLVSEYLTF